MARRNHLSAIRAARVHRAPGLLDPKARVHSITYHGSLALGSTIRDRIVPSPPPSRPCGEGVAAAACCLKYTWADLMRPVFGLDVPRCHACCSHRQIIALITQADVIQRILKHLGLPADAPPVAPARAHPT